MRLCILLIIYWFGRFMATRGGFASYGTTNRYAEGVLRSSTKAYVTRDPACPHAPACIWRLSPPVYLELAWRM